MESKSQPTEPTELTETTKGMFKYETVPGLFLQDEPATDAKEFDYV